MWKALIATWVGVLQCLSVCRAYESIYDYQTLMKSGQDTICSIMYQRAAVLGDKLYFMSGNYTFYDVHNGSTYSSYIPLLLSIDLSNEFETEKNLSLSSLGQLDFTQHLAEDVSYELGNVPGGGLFQDNETLYMFSGGDQTSLPTSSIPAYNTSTDSWEMVPVSGHESNFSYYGDPSWISNPATGHSYLTAVGGDYDVAPGLIDFDASNPSQTRWTNLTNGHGSSGVTFEPLGFSQLLYVPYGKAGVLLTFGGYNPGDDKLNTGFDHLTWTYVFDIDSHTWYNVSITGVNGIIPPNRSNFCAGVSRAPDDSSFQVTLFGGQSQSDLVWILTLPSFQWINVTPQGLSAEEKDATLMRTRAKCFTRNDAQMIVLGGEVIESTPSYTGILNNVTCRDGFYPLRVLDTSSYQWKEKFDPNLNYSVPTAVTDVIGGDGSGNAQTKEPKGGWKNPALATIFANVVPREENQSKPAPKANANPTSPTPESQPASQSPTSTKTSVKVGAAVGSIVGVVALVGIISALVLLHKRKTRRDAGLFRTRSELDTAQTKHELPAETGMGQYSPRTGERLHELFHDNKLSDFSTAGRNKLHELFGDHVRTSDRSRQAGSRRPSAASGTQRFAELDATPIQPKQDTVTSPNRPSRDEADTSRPLQESKGNEKSSRTTHLAVPGSAQAKETLSAKPPDSRPSTRGRSRANSNDSDTLPVQRTRGDSENHARSSSRGSLRNFLGGFV